MVAVLLFTGCLNAQVKEERKIASFRSINVSSAIKVVLSMGASESVVFEAKEEVLSSLKAEVKDGKLLLYMEKRSSGNDQVIAYVSAKVLHAIKTSGAAGLELTNQLETTSLSIEGSGASQMKLNLKVNDLKAELEGASKIFINGKAGALELDLSGAGSFVSKELKADSVKIKATGASQARVSAASNLKVNATGASKIIYSGKPENKDIFTSGAASVKPG